MAVALIAFGVGLLSIWLGPRALFRTARFGVGAVVTGAAALSYDKLVKAPRGISHAGPAPTHLPAIRFLGRDTNLIAVQLLATFYLIERAFWSDVDAARWAAVVVIALGVILYSSRVRLAPMLLAGAAAAYAVVITSMMTNFAFRFEMDSANIAEGDLVVPLWLVGWVVAVIAAFPQLQLIRWGRISVGAIKGDVVIDRGGSPVLLAFGSATLIAAAVTTASALNDGWYWLNIMFS